jgi:hypothetical protein
MFLRDASVSCGRRQSGAYCADPGDRIVCRYRYDAGLAVRDGAGKIAEGIDMDEFSARRLNDVIGVLTEQRNIVVGRGAVFAGHLIDLAIVQLRMTLHDISEEELSEFSNLLSVNRGRGREHSD